MSVITRTSAGLSVSFTLCLHAALWVASYAVLCSVVPIIASISVTGMQQPPAITDCVLEAARFVNSASPLIVGLVALSALALFLFVDARVLFRLWRIRDPAIATTLWSHAMTAIPILLISVSIGSTLAPLYLASAFRLF